MSFEALIWFPLAVTVAIVAGALAGYGPMARRFALLLGLVYLTFGFMPPKEHTLIRGVTELACIWGFMKLLWILRSQPLSLPNRVWQAIAQYDIEETKRVPPRLDAKLAGKVALFTPVALAMFYLALYVGPTTQDPVLWRFVAGVPGMYAAAEVAAASVQLVHLLFGFELPKVHDDPIKSTTILEFWGRRWNRSVGTWLYAMCFKPLARRRRAALGVVMSFVVSALIHFGFTLAGLGLGPALVMSFFFLGQIPLVALERKLRLGRRPAWVGRSYTIGSLALLSPLFSDPFLGLLDGQCFLSTWLWG